jgi:hypothetical protein
VDEKAFLEDRRKRIIEVSGLGKTPQVFGDLGCQAEKVGKDAASLFYTTGQIRRCISQ